MKVNERMLKEFEKDLEYKNWLRRIEERLKKGLLFKEVNKKW